MLQRRTLVRECVCPGNRLGCFGFALCCLKAHLQSFFSQLDQVAALLAMAHAHIEDYHPPVHDPAIDLSGYCTAIHVS